MRVLLVEHHDDSREVIRVMLNELGHEVIEAATGKEAVIAAVRTLPALILMDLGMLEVDGLQSIAAIRAISSVRGIPIIATTAFPSEFKWRKARQAGCDAYLLKPFDADGLDRALAQIAKMY